MNQKFTGTQKKCHSLAVLMEHREKLQQRNYRSKKANGSNKISPLHVKTNGLIVNRLVKYLTIFEQLH